jgi:PAS domain S-box-containing protein
MLKGEGRTRVTDTLSQTQQSIDRALRDARIGLWVWDMQSNNVYFSPEWKRQLGYQDHELRSRFGEFEERLHPQDRNSILATLKAYVEGRRPDYEVEFRLRHKDGTYRWIFSHAFLQTGADGKPCRVSGCHLDITDRKEAEKERARLLAGMRASSLEADIAQPQLGNILESISDGFVALDKTWRYTYVNRQAAGLFGRSPQDLIGKHIWTEFPEGVGQPFHLAYEKAMTKQIFIQTENYYEPWDRWFENRIYPSSNGISIFFHEITERKQAEQVARENAALLRGQNDVLELIAQGTPLAKTLDFLLLFIEAQCSGMLGSILLLDADGVHVRHGAAPSLPSSFTEAIDGQRIGPAAGSCGTAAFRREPVIVEDIATDALWNDYRDFALKHDLRACWSIPIFDEQRHVLGTFALYFRTPGRPTARHWQLIETTTQAAAFAIVKQRETEALRTSEERLRLAVTGGNVGIWEWDVGTNRLVWSDQLKAMFGWPTEADDLTLKMFMDAIHPEDRFRVDAALQRSLAERSNYEVEYRILQPNGSLRWVAAKGCGEYDANGAAMRMMGVALDITERKRAEDMLRRSEERFQIVARATSDAIWDWDLVTNAVWWNQGLNTLFQYSTGEVGSDASWKSEHIHPEDLQKVESGIRDVMKRGEQFWSGEYRFRRADGSYADIFDRGFVIYDSTRTPVRMLGAIADISERKRALEMLEQRVATRTAELQAKNRELEHEISQRKHVEELLRARNEELKAFAYTVSHDLKAPLRGIDGYARELDRRHRQGLSERALFCLAQILTATHNLDRLIEDLLHYSRLDAETPTGAEVNLAHMVDALLRDRKPVILEHNTQVDVSLLSTKVHTWERGLFQVLTNLIDNAVKYSRDAKSPRIEITSQELADAFRIMISDNGIGFDMKYHDRIFGLFNRLVRQEEFEGTGAGLAIAKKVVEKLGGKIWAESKLGSGAKFFIEVPKKGPVGSGE